MEQRRQPQRHSRTVYYPAQDGIVARKGIDSAALDLLPRFSANAPPPPGLFVRAPRSLHLGPAPEPAPGKQRRQVRDGKL